jgi:prolyl oligopeptidase
MKTLASLALTLLLCLAGATAAPSPSDPLAPLGAPPVRPALAQLKPVTETLWGRQVTDNYRYMEALDPPTLAWIKAQGAYTRSVLEAIAGRAALLQKIAAFTGSFGATQGYVRYGGRAFYEQRVSGSDNVDLFVRDALGTRKIIDVAALRAAHGGTPYAINFFFVSPDGSKVAAGISQGGSEAAAFFVYDALSGRQLAGPADRANPGFATWSADSSCFYFTRLKQPVPGEADEERFRNTRVFAWDLKSEPVAAPAIMRGPGASFLPDETPMLTVWPHAPYVMLSTINGVEAEQAIWLAPAAQLNDPKAHWQAFAKYADGVTGVDARGDTLFLLSHKDAPTFRVLSVRAGQPLRSATVLVPAVPDRVIDSIHAASDALYVLARRGAYSLLLRIAHGSAKVEPVALPFKGHIGDDVFTDPRQPGITIRLQSFVVPPTVFTYDPVNEAFTDLKLGTGVRFDSSHFEVRDLEARAQDGVRVPDTLVRAREARGPQVLLIQAYGAYGMSQLADFSPRTASYLLTGGSYASCHVRGGGELGEAWRLGGKDANKPHSWRDLIACAADLIARGYTTQDKLFIFGGSAGGITIGRAFTERPDLFAGAIELAPDSNTLRSEFQPSGPMNVSEGGTIKEEQGFRNLFEEDTIQHISAGVQYPPVLIATGLNDPRTAPWEPAKLVAALQASATTRPVLLRVDPDAGHGIGSTKAQNDELYADMWAFVLWRSGLSGWRPTFAPK